MQKKDIRLEIKVRNNLILTKMEEAGIESVADLCRKLGGNYPTQQARVGALINMKIAARKGEKDNNEWRPLALDLAILFKCEPEDLFSDPQQHHKLAKNRAKAELGFLDIQRLTSRVDSLEDVCQQHELEGAVSRVLSTLTPREERVLRMRFGIGAVGDSTLEEVATVFGPQASRERIRQIETKALKKLNTGSRRKFLKRFVEQ